MLKRSPVKKVNKTANKKIVLYHSKDDVIGITDKLDNNKIVYDETIYSDRIEIKLLDEDDWSFVRKILSESKSNITLKSEIKESYEPRTVEEQIRKDIEDFYGGASNIDEQSVNKLTEDISGIMEAEISSPQIKLPNGENESDLMNTVNSMMG